MDIIKNLLKNKIFRVTILLIVLLLPFTSSYRVVFVIGHSMHPTYKHKEIVIEEKISSLGKFWKPNRGDVVVVLTKDREKLIKRVIGLEGEYIEIKHGRIYINDKKYKDYYAHLPTPPSEDDWRGHDLDVGAVPKGYVWVIGDNRHMSWCGLVKVKEIKGKVLY